MRSNSTGPFARAAAIFVASTWCGQALAAVGIHGAGATFPAPVYSAWSAEYRRSSGVQVQFDAVGSGAGIERIRRRLVDFGASDAALTPRELEASDLLQFPIIIGGVVPVVNIRGIRAGQLTLSGALLAEIYLGRITKWNDAAIGALNPGLVLPNVNITVVHRSDPSGSTLLWTDYLLRSSPAWRAAGIGSSLAPRWPNGVGGTGNEGVASYVQRTRFAIGYVEFIYARTHHLSDVALLNRSGNVVQAGRAAFAAAAAAADLRSIAATQEQMATDLRGAACWPITGASFILVSKSPENAEQTMSVLRFFDWAIRHGEPLASGLEYASLPRSLADQLPGLWSLIHDGAGASLWH